ncbi:MAG TPA: TIGR03000 domain-containing protein [Gemmataceae bacterium]|nr:TIGR03000 domain-containing protein [Gemmataceae bacterium]
MYTMVLMAALTTATDMPDRGRRGGCCGGCYGGSGMGMGCYGGGYGMGMGCYGGYGMGYGGGYGYGGGGRSGYGYGYGGYTLGTYSPMLGSNAYSPMMNTWGWNTPFVSGGAVLNQGMNQSFYYNTGMGNEATIVVHLPAEASLSIDGQQTQQRSDTRTFTSPPLEPGKTYTYTIRAEMKRDGHLLSDTQTVTVRAGRLSETTMKLSNANRREEDNPPDR